MPAPLPVRTGRDPAGPRRLARRERDGRAGARLPALADAPDGPPRGEAAGLAGATGRTLGDRAHRHDTAGVAGPRDRPRPRALDEGRRAAPKAVVPRGPDLARDGRVARRARDLRAPVEARFGVRHREGGTPRPLEGLDPSRRKTRPVHPEAGPGARARLEKARPAWRARRRTGAPGRIGSGCGPWTRGGRAASRTSGAGRARARAGRGGRASPRRTWSGRSARSAARASRRRCPRPRPRRRASSSPSRRAVPAGTRAAPVLDGAGRHAGGEPGVPPTLTLVHPPPHGPGPDPVERAWERLRDRRLSRRVPAGGDEAVVDAARAARDAPLAEPGRLRSPADFPRLPASVTTS